MRKCFLIFLIFCLILSMASAADIYSCPMHPQITSLQPGNCRICGMTLEKKEIVVTGNAAASFCPTANNHSGDNDFVMGLMMLTCPIHFVVGGVAKLFGK